MSASYITLDDDAGEKKPDDMSWTEWRKYLREREKDPEEILEREERRRRREEGYPEYKESLWGNFKMRLDNTLPSKTSTGACCCCAGLSVFLVVIVLGTLLFALLVFYLKHGGFLI